MTHNEYPPAPLTAVQSTISPAVQQFEMYDDDKEMMQERRSAKTQSTKTGFFMTLQSIYFGISGVLGFGERFSLLFFILLGGTLFGFCFARVSMMIPSKVENETVPGEWYWYRQPLFKHCIFVHIYLNIIAGVFAIFQFIPMIRRRKIILHRINGYFVLSTLLTATITGSVVGRRAFGGEPNTQIAFYTLGSMIGFAAFMGISNVRKTRKHRKWMLRTVAYTSSVITARIIAIITRAIISISASYYAVWTCDEISFLLGDSSRVAAKFPACIISSGEDPKSIYVPVHASVHEAPINLGSAQRLSFGMALWLAMLIHVAVVEIYIRATESYQWPPRSLEAVHQYDSEGLK